MGWYKMSSAGKYAYLAPKAFYEKGMLLKPGDYLSLVEARNLEDLLLKLEDTPYKRYITKIEGEVKPEHIEHIALRAQAEVVKKVYRASPEGKPKELLNTFKERIVVRELKSIIRSLVEGYSFKDSESRVDWELLEILEVDRIFKLILSYESLKDVINYLKNLPYRKYIEEAESAYQATRDSGVYDMFLDKYIVEKLAKNLEELKGGDKAECTPLIMWDTDFYNVNVIVRGRRIGLPVGIVAKLIVRYGSIGGGAVASRLMMSENPIAELAYTRLGYEARRYGIQKLTLDSLEILYRRRMYQLCIRRFLSSPFHLGLAVALAYLKEIEAKTLAGIAVAVNSGLRREEIMEILPIITS